MQNIKAIADKLTEATGADIWYDAATYFDKYSEDSEGWRYICEVQDAMLKAARILRSLESAQ